MKRLTIETLCYYSMLACMLHQRCSSFMTFSLHLFVVWNLSFFLCRFFLFFLVYQSFMRWAHTVNPCVSTYWDVITATPCMSNVMLSWLLLVIYVKIYSDKPKRPQKLLTCLKFVWCWTLHYDLFLFIFKKKFTSLLALHVYLHVMLHKAGSCKGYLNKPTADI